MSGNLTQDEFVQKVNKKYNGKFEVVSEYINARTPVKIRHRDCGTVFPKVPNALTAKSKNVYCPICDGYHGKTPLVGINDLWSTHPNIAKMLKNPEDGYQVSHGSGAKKDFLCEYCGETVNEAVNHVVRYGYVTCKFCSDGVRYPNRFMANLLKTLNIEFETEYIIKPYPYKYDFYFNVNQKYYVVEMDGGIGHGNKTYDGKKDCIGLETDQIKDSICYDNDIEPIRIDCNYKSYNRFEHVKQSVISSKLSLLFNLDDIDFELIDKLSCSSLTIDIVNYWKSGNKSYDELKALTSLCRLTIRRYLKDACEKGFIDDTYENILKEIRLASNKKLASSKGTRVMCDQTGEVYYSIAEAERQTGIKHIRNFFCQKRNYAGQLSDGTKLTWTKISNEKYEQILLERASNNECSFLM